MPVLRMPTDTSLGDTLGNLGRTLSEGLNPLNMARYYDIQQQMWLRNQQLIEAQRKNAATQAAIGRYSHLVPSDALPEIANMIYQGAPADQIGLRAAQLSGRLVDDPSDAGTNQNIQTLARDFGVQWKEIYPPVAGAATQANRLKVEAAQAGATTSAQRQAEVDVQTKNEKAIAEAEGLKAGAVTGAQKQAEVDVQTKNEKAIAEAEGLKAGAVEQGRSIAKQNAIDALTKQQIDDPAHDDQNRILAQAIEALGGPKAPEPGFTVPVGPKTNVVYQQQKANQAGTIAQQTKAGEQVGSGVRTDVQTVYPAGPPGSPGNPVTRPVGAPASDTAAPPTPLTPTIPKGATQDPTRPGWYWTGGQLHPPTVGTSAAGPTIGVAPGDQPAANEASAGASKVLNDAYQAGTAATKLTTITQQLRGLEQIANTKGFWGQTNAAINDFLTQYHLGGVTNQQMAQQLMKQLVTTELPGMLQQYDIVRFAKPEIDLMNRVIGDPTASPDMVNAILANLDTAAQYTLKRKDLASQALGYGSSADPTNQGVAINYPEFQQGDAALLNDYNKQAQVNRDKVNAIGSNRPPAPRPVQTTEGGANPTPSFWETVGHFFSGLGQPPQPPSNAPPQTPDTGQSHELQYDPTTNQWR